MSCHKAAIAKNVHKEPSAKLILVETGCCTSGCSLMFFPNKRSKIKVKKKAIPHPIIRKLMAKSVFMFAAI